MKSSIEQIRATRSRCFESSLGLGQLETLLEMALQALNETAVDPASSHEDREHALRTFDRINATLDRFEDNRLRELSEEIVAFEGTESGDLRRAELQALEERRKARGEYSPMANRLALHSA